MDTIETRRRIVTACYALTGLLTAVWGAGIPALDARLQLGTAMLGTLLLILAGCALLAMRLTGAIAARGGRMLPVALPAAGAALALAGSAPDTGVLMVASALFGLACGAVNIALSTEAMTVESASGRPVIARMHGFWTLGAAGGGILLAAVLHGDIDSRLAISAPAVLLAIVGSVVAVRLAPRPARAASSTSGAPSASISRSGFRAGVALGLLGAATFITEGAATDWAGVHATRVLDAEPAIGSAVYGLFFGAMALVRFVGDAVRAVWGPVRTLRITGAVAVAGYAAVLTSGAIASHPSALFIAIVGWVIAGAGTALIWPIVIGTLAASGQDSRRLSVVTMISYGGGLVGPALIGFLAEFATLPVALLLPASLVVVVAIVAPSVVQRSLRSRTPVNAFVPEPNTQRSTP